MTYVFTTEPVPAYPSVTTSQEPSNCTFNETCVNGTNINEFLPPCSGNYINVTCELPIRYAVPLYGYVMPYLLVITIIANTLIVVVLSKRHMRTPTNVVLMAMALCDMFTLLVPAPWLIYMYTFGNHYKPLFPIGLCYAWQLMYEVIPNVFHTISIWLTLLLAVQRYIYVCHAPLARKFCTLPNVYKFLRIIIIVSALHQCTRLFDRHYVAIQIAWNNHSEYVCSAETSYWVKEYITEDVYYCCYYLFRIIFVHLAPCISLIVLNILLVRALKAAQQRRDILLAKKKQKSECTTMMLVVVVSAFLVVEIPLAVVTILHVLSSTVIRDLLDYDLANSLVLLTNFVIILSYPINFAIYCGMSRQFRETFKELFMRGVVTNRNGGSSRYSIVNGPRTCTNETVL